jgi:hypothetical protein
MLELGFGQLMQPAVMQVKRVEATSLRKAMAMSVVGGMPIMPNNSEPKRLPALEFRVHRTGGRSPAVDP